ncbi:MAG: ImmA/IrrE family metallo-endopeptidase [Dongiaceae bacterium]
MNLPTKPISCAIRITQLIQAVQRETGEVFYPISVEKIAIDISRQFFPDEPISEVMGINLGDCEGMLCRVPGKKEWKIIYNNSIRSKGRVNFTVAHELGHYLLHRTSSSKDIKCTYYDMMSWDSAYGKREAEANEFASYFLMPRDLFEAQIKNNKITLHLMQHIANYFEVSLTAAILRWLKFTNKRAMLVIGKDGFVDWAWSSEFLYKSGIVLRGRKETIELPIKSLAACRNKSFDNEAGLQHEAGIWPFKESVYEMTLIIDDYDNKTISLLLFEDRAPFRHPKHNTTNSLKKAS